VALGAATRDDSPEVAAAACLALGRTGSTAAPRYLLKALEGEGKVRQPAAAEALAVLGPAARGAVPELVSRLASPGAGEEWPEQVLVDLGPLAVPGVMEGLKGPDRERRHRAAFVLVGLGPQAREAGPALVEALQDRDGPAWPSGQIVLLGATPQAPLALVPLLAEEAEHDDAVRLALVGALARTDPGLAGPFLPLLLRLVPGRHGPIVVSVLADLGPAAHPLAPQLVALVGGKDAEAARLAAEALGKIRAPAAQAVPALRAGLKGPPAVRVACADALGLLGPPAKDAIPDLLRALTDGAVRPAAALALSRVAPERTAEAAQALMADLEGEDSGAWLSALRKLWQFDTVPAEVVAVLRLRLGDSGQVQDYALGLLDRLGPESAAAVPGLVGLLSEKNAGLREAAGAVLARIGKPAFAGLKTALRSPSPTTRLAAAAAIARLPGTWDDEAALLALLNDEVREVRLGAAEALRAVPRLSDAAVQALLPWLGKSESDVRRQAARTLARAPARARAGLTVTWSECLLDPDEGVRLSAVEALAWPKEVGEPPAALVTALVDASPLVRLKAAQTLRGPEADEALVRLLSSPAPLVRAAAAAALLERGGQGAAAIAALGVLEADWRGGDLQQRLGAAELLARFDATKARAVVPWLEALLSNPRARIRAPAAQVLGALGKRAKSARAALERRAWQDDEPVVRTAAREALGKM
jgi:HEAT repeat protein